MVASVTSTEASPGRRPAAGGPLGRSRLGWLAAGAVAFVPVMWGLADPWTHPAPTGGLFLVALLLSALAVLVVRLLLAYMPLRLALTPGSTEARRVRRRAVDLFRASAERRTRARTGVLLYLSLAEHRAEIVADEAIHGRVAPELWGEAMAVLVERTRAGRPGEGIAAAVERIGAVLHEHFPRSEGDVNELPDHLVEL